MNSSFSSVIQFVITTFNNREIAAIIWVTILGILAMTKADVRTSIGSLIKTFSSPKILIPTFILFGYIAAAVYLLRFMGLWHLSHLKGAIYWSVGGAFVLFMNTSKANEKPYFFRSVILDNLKFACVLEYIVGLHTFSLWVEIITLPIVTLFAGSLALSEIKPEYKSVKKLLTFLLASYSLVVLVLSALKIAHNISQFANYSSLIDFLLPIVYTLMILPLIYVFALWMTYERLFVRMRIFNKENQKLFKFARWRILAKFNINLSRLNQWVKRMGGNLRIANKEEFVALLTKPNSEMGL